MQITTTHLLLLYYAVIDRYWPTQSRNTKFSQCNLIYRLYILRSFPNLHHSKDLFLASQFEYELNMFWIISYKVSKSQNFDPGFGRTTGPPPPIWADTGATRISSMYLGPPGCPRTTWVRNIDEQRNIDIPILSVCQSVCLSVCPSVTR